MCKCPDCGNEFDASSLIENSLIKDLENKLKKNQVRTNNNEIIQLKSIIEELKLEKVNLQNQLTQQSDKIKNLKAKEPYQDSSYHTGRALENIIVEKLNKFFPRDIIKDITKRKGKSADVLQTIFSKNKEVGKILIEAKNSSVFQNIWIEKVKNDQREINADVSVIITKTLPSVMKKNNEELSFINGVWICAYDKLEVCMKLLREQLLKIFEIRLFNEDSIIDKDIFLIEYFNSTEFKNTYRSLTDSYDKLSKIFQKEREQFEKNYEIKQKEINNILKGNCDVKKQIRNIIERQEIMVV